MPHETALIATIAAGLGLAFIFGFAAHRLHLPPIVGYLVAGIAIGPFTPGFVADAGLAGQLAEIGVILLMFGVGLHFSVNDLVAARKIALPGAIIQVIIATMLGAGAARFWGWPVGEGVVFGLALSGASTVVLLRALDEHGMSGTDDGRIAVGWLVVEDLVMVLALVLLPAASTLLGGNAPAGASDASAGITILVTIAKVIAFIAVMLVVGRRFVPWLLERVARSGSRELFTLAVLAVALGIAVGSAELFGVSFALGAFFAGMIINESEVAQRAATEALPLQDAFAVLFFVSVGMLFHPGILLQEPLRVLTVFLVIVGGKSLVALMIVLAFGRSLRTALVVAASLAQIGEFAFILASLGITLGLLRNEAQSLILAGAIFSITFNSAMFALIKPAERWLVRGNKRVG